MSMKRKTRSGTKIYKNTEIGKSLETGHNVVIRERNRIGDNCKIWSNTVIDYECSIGNNVKIHCGCYIAQYTIIEDDVFIAPGVVISNDFHPGCRFSKVCMRGPRIGKGSSIGCNSTILPGVSIGKRCLIAAGSVVTKDVPDFTVVRGNPARPHGSIFDLKCKTGLNIYTNPYQKE